MTVKNADFTIEDMVIITTLAREKNFRITASKLFMSQPSVSKKLKILEENLDLKLFNRNSKTVTVTEAGELLLQYGQRILNICEEAKRAISDLQNGERGTLVLGGSQTTGTYLLPRVMAPFSRENSEINVNEIIDSTRNIAQNIINGQIDIAIVGGDIPEQYKDKLNIDFFMEDKLSLIVPITHPLANNPDSKITKMDLYNLTFITLNSNSTTQNFIDTTLKQNDINVEQFNIKMKLNSIEAIKTAVSYSNVGAAFVSQSAIEKEISLKRIKVLNIENMEITRKLVILTKKDITRSKSCDLFYEEIEKLKTQSTI